MPSITIPGVGEIGISVSFNASGLSASHSSTENNSNSNNYNTENDHTNSKNVAPVKEKRRKVFRVGNRSVELPDSSPSESGASRRDSYMTVDSARKVKLRRSTRISQNKARASVASSNFQSAEDDFLPAIKPSKKSRKRTSAVTPKILKTVMGKKKRRNSDIEAPKKRGKRDSSPGRMKKSKDILKAEAEIKRLTAGRTRTISETPVKKKVTLKSPKIVRPKKSVGTTGRPAKKGAARRRTASPKKAAAAKTGGRAVNRAGVAAATKSVRKATGTKKESSKRKSVPKVKKPPAPRKSTKKSAAPQQTAANDFSNLDPSPTAASAERDELKRLGIKQLKQRCSELGLNSSQCVEKTDLVNLILNSKTAATSSFKPTFSQPSGSQHQPAKPKRVSPPKNRKPSPPKVVSTLHTVSASSVTVTATSLNGVQSKKVKDLTVVVQRIIKESNKGNSFAVLGLNTRASQDDVKKAHRELAKQLHPDKLSQLNIPNAQDAYTKMTLAKDACLAKSKPKQNVLLPEKPGAVSVTVMSAGSEGQLMRVKWQHPNTSERRPVTGFSIAVRLARTVHPVMDVSSQEEEFVISQAMFPILWNSRRNLEVLVAASNSTGNSGWSAANVQVSPTGGFK